MASEKATPPEGFKTVDKPESNNDYDTEWVDRPEVSETLVGTLLAVKHDRGEYDSSILEIRLIEDYQGNQKDSLVAVWSTDGINQMLEENDVNRGDDICLYVDSTFESDDETRRSYALATAE